MYAKQDACDDRCGCIFIIFVTNQSEIATSSIKCFFFQWNSEKVALGIGILVFRSQFSYSITLHVFLKVGVTVCSTVIGGSNPVMKVDVGIK